MPYPYKDVEHGEYQSEGADVVESFPCLLVVKGFASPHITHCHAPENIEDYQTCVYQQ